ncbi:hypothetical protein D3C75_1113560 [compost metagenome]
MTSIKKAVSVRMPALLDVMFSITDIMEGTNKATKALLKGFLYTFLFLWHMTRRKYDPISARQ